MYVLANGSTDERAYVRDDVIDLTNETAAYWQTVQE